METQPPGNRSLCFYGGTEMTSSNELRDRIADAIYAMGADDLNTVPLPAIAQAVIDSLGLTKEWSFRFEGEDARIPLHRPEDIRTIGLYGPLEDAVIEARTVGKWEEQ